MMVEQLDRAASDWWRDDVPFESGLRVTEDVTLVVRTMATARRSSDPPVRKVSDVPKARAMRDAIPLVGLFSPRSTLDSIDRLTPDLCESSSSVRPEPSRNTHMRSPNARLSGSTGPAAPVVVAPLQSISLPLSLMAPQYPNSVGKQRTSLLNAVTCGASILL